MPADFAVFDLLPCRFSLLIFAIPVISCLYRISVKNFVIGIIFYNFIRPLDGLFF